MPDDRHGHEHDPPPPPPPPAWSAPHPPPGAQGPTVGGAPEWATAGSPAAEPPLGGRLLPLRPLTVGDVLDGAFRLLRDRFGRVALLVIVVLGPYQLLTSFALDRWVPQMGALGGLDGAGLEAGLSDEMMGRAATVGTLAALLGALTYLLVGVALVHGVLREDAGGRPAEVGEALRAGLRRLWAAVGASLLLAVIGFAGGFAVLLLGLLLGAVSPPLALLVAVPAGLLVLLTWSSATSLVVPVAGAEPARGAASTAVRALSLLRRRYWRIVGTLVLVFVVVAMVSFAVSLVLGVAALAAGPVAWVVDGVSGTLVSVVTTPATVFAALLLYLDARVRLEGLDLEVRAPRADGPW